MMSIKEDGTSNKKMKIISIVGFGGLGKTTLAKAVYHKVNGQFDCSAFVPVGRNPDPRKVLRDILVDLTNDTEARKTITTDEKRYTSDDLMGLDVRQLIDELRKFLEGKRYFIVIDDLWDTLIWGIITNAFVESNCGSIIVVTSRNGQVSAEIGDVYRIKELSASNSRILLYTRTFGAEDNWPDNNDEVAEVSDKILRKCHGVPLAIITIASLLAKKHIEEWPSVYNSIGFRHGDNQQMKNTMKILSFSYYDLPSHLRTCMLYLSVYPEDYVVEKERLVRRWIAEDLVHMDDGKAIFEVADSYFHELLNRGLVMPKETNGIVTGCRVHDMVLHMIRDIARHENFVSVQDSEQWSQGNIRRLALHPDGHIQVNDMGMPQLRSFNAILCSTNMAQPVLSGFQVLRVLALEHCRPLEDYDLKHIAKLLHLRYLGLNNTRVLELPKEVGDLKFLQTLLLDGTGIEQLPTSLGQLTKLMCLHADKKTSVPDWIGKLTSLVQLTGMSIAADDKCSVVKELGKLRELRVLDTSLDIEDEGLGREFLLSLMNLQKLESISVTPSKPCVMKAAVVMQPSPVLCCNNLRVLLFNPLIFSRLPAWIKPQNLPNLCSLFLFLFELDQQDVEILGRFQNLSDLHLQAVGEVSAIISICGGGRFRNLKYFIGLGLRGVKFEQEAMPRLETLLLGLPVLDIKANNLGLDIGLGNLSSLQRFIVYLEYCFCYPHEVGEMEAELRQAVSIHPNRPTVEMSRDVASITAVSDFEILEPLRQRGGLWDRVFGQMEIYEAMVREALDYQFNDAKDKVQAFIAQCNATGSCVYHELLPLRKDNRRIHDHDLSTVAEEIAVMERVHKIHIIEYPRLAAMLDRLRSPFSLQEATPGLDVIILNIRVCDVKIDSPGLDFGLGNLSSLQEIKAHIECSFCFPTEVEEVEDKLRQTVNMHPNTPTLEITRSGEDKMVTSSDLPTLKKRQLERGGRIFRRMDHQMKLHEGMHREAVKMVVLKSDMNLSDAQHKVQQFLRQLDATVRRAKRERLLMLDSTPVHDRDLNRLAEDNADMERAIDILTAEYPRFAAKLDGLRYVFNQKVAMPRHEVSTLTIDVFDVMVRHLGLDFGLGNLSSLQEIKAHIDCHLCLPNEIQEVEAELRYAVDIHPNRPTLEITKYCVDKVPKSDSDMLERQICKAGRLWSRINHQKELYDAMHYEAVEMNKLNVSNAEHKMRRFFDQYNATVDHIRREQPPVQDYNKHIHHQDLLGVTQYNTAIERALEICIREHPRLATMLEEQRAAFSLQVCHSDRAKSPFLCFRGG